jgi:prophage regulatory protein
MPHIIGNPKADPPIPAILPIGKTKFWALVKSGKFPAALKLSERVSVWREDDVNAYIAALSGGK